MEVALNGDTLMMLRLHYAADGRAVLNPSGPLQICDAVEQGVLPFMFQGETVFRKTHTFTARAEAVNAIMWFVAQTPQGPQRPPRPPQTSRPHLPQIRWRLLPTETKAVGETEAEVAIAARVGEGQGQAGPLPRAGQVLPDNKATTKEGSTT